MVQNRGKEKAESAIRWNSQIKMSRSVLDYFHQLDTVYI